MKKKLCMFTGHDVQICLIKQNEWTKALKQKLRWKFGSNGLRNLKFELIKSITDLTVEYKEQANGRKEFDDQTSDANIEKNEKRWIIQHYKVKETTSRHLPWRSEKKNFDEKVRERG